MKIEPVLGDKVWRYSEQSSEWAGHAVMRALDCDAAEAKRIISRLIADGTLIKFTGRDERRKPVPCVQVAPLLHPAPPE